MKIAIEVLERNYRSLLHDIKMVRKWELKDEQEWAVAFKHVAAAKELKLAISVLTDYQNKNPAT